MTPFSVQRYIIYSLREPCCNLYCIELRSAVRPRQGKTQCFTPARLLSFLNFQLCVQSFAWNLLSDANSVRHRSGLCDNWAPYKVEITIYKSIRGPSFMESPLQNRWMDRWQGLVSKATPGCSFSAKPIHWRNATERVSATESLENRSGSFFTDGLKLKGKVGVGFLLGVFNQKQKYGVDGILSFSRWYLWDSFHKGRSL